jgi:hypothetical protein
MNSPQFLPPETGPAAKSLDCTLLRNNEEQ